MAHLTNFSFEFVYEIFTEDASLCLLYHSAKKSKMTKNSNQVGSCLKIGHFQPRLQSENRTISAQPFGKKGTFSTELTFVLTEKSDIFWTFVAEKQTRQMVLGHFQLKPVKETSSGSRLSCCRRSLRGHRMMLVLG